MPVIIAGGIDTDSIPPDTVYSDESCVVEASNIISITSESFVDIADLTISLTLGKSAAVLQLAQVDFQRECFQPISFRTTCDQQVMVGIKRQLRFSTSWQNAFLVAFWPGLSAGIHVFKVQCTKGALRNRKHCLVIMRI